MGKLTMLNEIEERIVDTIRRWHKNAKRDDEKDLGCIYIGLHNFKPTIGEDEDSYNIVHYTQSNTLIERTEYSRPYIEMKKALAESLLKEVDDIGKELHELRNEESDDD